MDTEWPPVKTQNVRLVDVFILGPAMIFAGAAATVSSRGSALMGAAGMITFFGGFATIAYNAINYGKIAQREKGTTKGLGDGGGYWQADPMWGEENAAWQRYADTGYYVQ